MIQIEFTDRIPPETIATEVIQFDDRMFIQNRQYYEGRNPTILNRDIKVVNAPNYKLPVSYARKIIRTVVGYMYKPGLITYNIEDDAYGDLLREVFEQNNEDTKTTAMGRQTSIQGVGYELHYVTPMGIPRFAQVPADRLIPVYTYDIEPQLAAAIRIARKTDEGKDIEVYYPFRVEYYFIPSKQMGNNPKIESRGSAEHLYSSVPVVVFENNEEQIGDFDLVIDLIDAYDLLISDSLNEFDRFAQAYLIMKGLSLKEEDVNKIKQRRIIETVDKESMISFLTKEIPSEYIRFMSEWIRKEIHKQTHVPDFTDTTLGTEMSGAALDRLFYDFEFIAADKEDRFRDALKRRVELINEVLRIRAPVGIPEVIEQGMIDIVMNRDKSNQLKELAETAMAYDTLISKRTKLEQFAPFVDDVDEELERLDEQNEDNPFRMEGERAQQEGFTEERETIRGAAEPAG